MMRIMPSYWPDKPHNPAYRRPLNKAAYWLYRRFGLRSRFWVRVWNEREVFRILRVLACQQVYGFVANPEGGDPIWYIDAPEDVQENRYPLNTCLLRGWMRGSIWETNLTQGFPIAQPLIPKGGSFDDFSKPPYYRLTTAGWNALYRQYTVSKIALAVSVLALVVSVTSAVVSVTNALQEITPPAPRIIFSAPAPPR